MSKLYLSIEKLRISGARRWEDGTQPLSMGTNANLSGLSICGFYLSARNYITHVESDTAGGYIMRSDKRDSAGRLFDG
jgi:hypothetical protein